MRRDGRLSPVGRGVKPLQARLMRLERAGNRTSQSCFVSIPVGMTHNEEVVHEAIADHQRRTGWMGPVWLVEPEVTEAEWLARYGRTD